MSGFGATLGLVFFGCGAAGFLIFVSVARAEKKIWPTWLGGVVAILLVAYVGGGVWGSGPANPGGLGVAVVFVAGWAGAGLVSWSLAALMVGAISSMK